MVWLKEFLTTETFPFFGFNISLFVLTAIVIIVILGVWLKLKNKPIIKNLINCIFISLTIITFMFAFLNALTGELLFSQDENMRLYMLIATVALFIYVIETTKKMFNS